MTKNKLDIIKEVIQEPLENRGSYSLHEVLQSMNALEKYYNEKNLKMELDSLLLGLNEASKLIYEKNKAKGFWDKERNVGELLMLVVSELGEAMEAHRKGNFTHDLFKGSAHTIKAFEENIKDTFEDEIADSVIRLMDLASGLNINLEWHILSKIRYNETRPRLHGKKY